MPALTNAATSSETPCLEGRQNAVIRDERRSKCLLMRRDIYAHGREADVPRCQE